MHDSLLEMGGCKIAERLWIYAYLKQELSGR